MRAPRAAPQPPAFEVVAPSGRRVPFVLASPHSGAHYPSDLIAQSGVDLSALRQLEDSFVDQLFGAGPALGAPLIRALLSRAYVDLNREPWELDPEMFEDALPAFVNSTSPRVSGGLGTIARHVASGAEIYRRKLRFAEAEARITACYPPYHKALRALVNETRERFGFAVLLDCHSMPSVGGAPGADRGQIRADVILGDRFGASCAPALTDAVERAFLAHGYKVGRNVPYAGGFTTHHYGRPTAGVHALQIEINRALYMDQRGVQPNGGMVRTRRAIGEVLSTLVGWSGAGALTTGQIDKKRPC
ncbi:MAG: N-formylglutamate amidohydrolase [Alphaproteobacteria bacterium]|nr:N-formylglutamate amidohydrolase [Alphaproteobacteria bacterium]